MYSLDSSFSPPRGLEHRNGENPASTTAEETADLHCGRSCQGWETWAAFPTGPSYLGTLVAVQLLLHPVSHSELIFISACERASKCAAIQGICENPKQNQRGDTNPWGSSRLGEPCWPRLPARVLPRPASCSAVRWSWAAAQSACCQLPQARKAPSAFSWAPQRANTRPAGSWRRSCSRCSP